MSIQKILRVIIQLGFFVWTFQEAEIHDIDWPLTLQRSTFNPRENRSTCASFAFQLFAFTKDFFTNMLSQCHVFPHLFYFQAYCVCTEECNMKRPKRLAARLADGEICNKLCEEANFRFLHNFFNSASFLDGEATKLHMGMNILKKVCSTITACEGFLMMNGN